MSSPPHADDGAEEGATRSDGGGKAFSYGEAGYWDARYVEEGVAPYDWYQRYAALRPFVRRFAPPASRLLMIGCGSALMSEDMVDDGYVEIMNIDISSVVIEMMRKKYFNVPQLQYMQMDVRDMGIFSDESFDCAIDKARPGFKGKTRRSILDPVPLTERGRLPDGFVPEDPDSHYIYVCKKVQGLTGTSSPTINHVETQDAE